MSRRGLRGQSRREFITRVGSAAFLQAAPRRDADNSAVTFTDVTAAAGLLGARNVSGSPGDKQFLLEEMGCGAAFFDYDHDGWLDIFLVNGSSFDPKVRDSRPASYLFHNNRDGTFTDVTKKAGLTHSGWGQALLRRGLRQRRLRRSLRLLLGAQRPLPEQRRRHIHRCVGESGRGRVAGGLGRGLLLRRLRP